MTTHHIGPITAHDFRKGTWGHRMHHQTFADAPVEKKWWHFLFPPAPVRRYSVMVHCSRHIAEGHDIIYRSEGGDKVGRIYRVVCEGNPSDMYTIYFEVLN